MRILFLIAALVAWERTACAANLVAKASSNFTTASTWGVAEAGASATQLTRDNSTNTTTSYVYSSAFTCTNTDVIEGVLVRVVRVNTTGTVSVALSDDNGTTATRAVTVNASDLPATDNSWVFFKFGSTLTCDGGTDYKVGVIGSSAGNATFYRDVTAGNWTRILRTNATQTPVAADNMYVVGEWTAAATETPLTVTMNETATTDYGLMDIGFRGTVTYGTVAATNYYLRLSGDLNIWNGGTLNIGTVATPMPSGSTAKLNLDSGSNVQYGLIVNNQGTLVLQGNPITVKSFLAADAAAAATALTTSTSTGWLNGDEIAIASTTRTGSEGEKKTMGANASGTSIGTIAALTNAHSGTAPTRAELGNLTRNVQIFGASATLQTYVLINPTATVNWDYAELYWMGSNTANKRGLNIGTTTGTVDIQYCALHDFVVANSVPFYMDALTSGSMTFSHNVIALTANRIFWIEPSTSTTWVIDDNLAIKNTDSAVGLYLNSTVIGYFTNNTIAGVTNYAIQMAVCNTVLGATRFTGNIWHSNGLGFQVQCPGAGSVIGNSTAWRNNATGIFLDNSNHFPYGTLVIDGYTAFGNGTSNLNLQANSGTTVIVNNATLNGDTTFSTASGLLPFCNFITLNNASMGVASGILTTHSTADINASNNCNPKITGSNVTLSSATQVSTPGTVYAGSYISFSKFGGVAGANKSWTAGSLSTWNITTNDTVIFNTASPSQRLTPATTANKFQSSMKQTAINSGATSTISVYARKSASGDAGGADYNGAQPRLMLKTNPDCGLGDGANDTVLDTMTVAVGNWELLTGTTSAVTANCIIGAYVDLDGTAGWVNVDDWTMTNSQPVGAEKYWYNGATNLTLSGAAAAAATLAYSTLQ